MRLLRPIFEWRGIKHWPVIVVQFMDSFRINKQMASKPLVSQLVHWWTSLYFQRLIRTEIVLRRSRSDDVSR